MSRPRIITIDKAKVALWKKFMENSPEVRMDCKRKRYTLCIQDNLIAGVCMKYFMTELRKGSGNELKHKFKAVHSSAALAVNCFAPFKQSLSDLSLLSKSGFEEFEFEKKCPTGLKKSGVPHLDAVVENKEFIIGIESKLTEHLEHTKPKKLYSYLNAGESENKHWCSKWLEEMTRLNDKPKTYHYLDAAQLIKHAFGMSNTYKSSGKAKVLLYVYWKPSNAQHYKKFELHCKDIEKLSCHLDGATPEFKAISYPELWNQWKNKTSKNDWLRCHVSNLRERYEVEVQDAR